MFCYLEPGSDRLASDLRADEGLVAPRGRTFIENMTQRLLNFGFDLGSISISGPSSTFLRLAMRAAE